MKFLDLLRMSASNLLRRKLRTVLTVLGVVIGTASIVVMISLGLGLQRSSLAQIERYGGLTTINVYNYNNGSYAVVGGAAAESDGETQQVENINDAVLDRMRQIEHVEWVTPVLDVYVIAKKGAYEGQFSIVGMTEEALRNLNVEAAEGRLPSEDGSLELFYGNTILTDFYNARTNESYWENKNVPDIDLMNDPVFIIFDTDAYWQNKWGGSEGETVPPPKKYIVPACGQMAGGIEEWGTYSDRALAEIGALETQLKKVFKGRAIPGQPTTSGGKPYKEIYYTNVMIHVDSMDNVESVQQAIRDMGYETDSNAEWMQQTQDQMRMIQLVLGGIGAVSLFVAAIGIANTMMMSIYERTKEIGIIKVLGCDLKNIRSMFLMEAGFIGFFGGVAGLILSETISIAINMVVANVDGGYYAGLSYIPLWLILIALAFAVLVGMMAGFFPALRAMKLSPLAAIRNE